MQRTIIICLIAALLAPCISALSQEAPDSTGGGRFSSRLDLSYMFGGQFYNDHFVYDPGIGVQFTQSFKVSSHFEAGIGTGYISLMNENFIPVYMEAFGYRKDRSSSPVVRFQLGGVVAWLNTAHYPADYSMNGGIFFSAGMGRKIELKRRYSVLFQWSVTHISARINYQVFGNSDYSSLAHYDMLQLSLGLIRN